MKTFAQARRPSTRLQRTASPARPVSAVTTPARVQQIVRSPGLQSKLKPGAQGGANELPAEGGLGQLRLQQDGPASSVTSYGAFTEAQRNFLRDNQIDPAGLPSAVANRLARLLSAVEQALQSGKDPTSDAGVSVVTTKNVGDAGADIALTAITAEASIVIDRWLDLGSGALQLQFAYQDIDGNRLESSKTLTPRRIVSLGSSELEPRILALPPLELGRGRPLELPSLPGEVPLPADETEASTTIKGLDDFSDLLPAETLPAGSPEAGSPEGIGSFFEGAILGDFGENDSWRSWRWRP